MNKRIDFSRALLILAFLWFSGFLLLAIKGKGLVSLGGMDAYYWYAAPGMLLCVALFFLNVKVRARATMTLLLLILGMYLIELVLMRLPNPSNLSERRARAAAREGVTFDQRDPIRVMKDFAAKGEPVTYAYVPPVTEYLAAEERGETPLIPLGGISARKTILGNESGDYALFHSDQHGFRNPTFAHAEVALVGDSFALGCSVPDGADVAGHLRPLVEVVTLGRVGNGPLMTLGSLREYGPTLKPKVVFWLYFEGNDLLNLRQEAKLDTLTSYLKEGYAQNLMNRQAEIDQLLSRRDEASLAGYVDRSGGLRKLIHFIKMHSLQGLARRPGPFEPPDELFPETLEQARAQVDDWGGELVFVYLPDRARYGSPGFSKHGLYRDEVLKTVESLNIPVVDIQRIFDKKEDPLSLFPFRLHGHYTEEGYALVANALMDWLTGKPDPDDR